MKQKQLIVITGPTAVGKTEVTLRFAEQEGLEILSSDSRQFYKEMNIGTAKPSQEELDRVPHHFINSLSIQQDYSAGDFERDGLEVLGQCFTRNNRVVLTGGSGLYIKALCEGFDEFPEVSKTISEEISQWSLEKLQKEVETLDPQYFQEVDLQNQRRLLRAVAVMKTSGQTFSSFRKNNMEKRDFEVKYMILNRDRAELYGRINQRVDQMMTSGLLEEVRQLAPFREHKALQTVGYQEFFPYFDGERTLDEAINLVKRNTRRYAKRQLTWFRKIQNAEWFHPDDFVLRYL